MRPRRRDALGRRCPGGGPLQEHHVRAQGGLSRAAVTHKLEPKTAQAELAHTRIPCRYASHGMRGVDLPPIPGYVPPVWTAGGEAEVTWQIRNNHGKTTPAAS